MTPERNHNKVVAIQIEKFIACLSGGDKLFRNAHFLKVGHGSFLYVKRQVKAVNLMVSSATLFLPHSIVEHFHSHRHKKEVCLPRQFQVAHAIILIVQRFSKLLCDHDALSHKIHATRRSDPQIAKDGAPRHLYLQKTRSSVSAN